MGGYFGIAGMVLGVPLFSVASEIIKKLVEAKLDKKGMDTALATYYPQNSYMKETVGMEDNKNKFIKRAIKRIKSKFKKNSKSSKK